MIQVISRVHLVHLMKVEQIQAAANPLLCTADNVFHSFLVLRLLKLRELSYVTLLTEGTVQYSSFN